MSMPIVDELMETSIFKNKVKFMKWLEISCAPGSRIKSIHNLFLGIAFIFI